MKLNYRNEKNAALIAAYWKKPLGKADCYKINAIADDEVEILVYDLIGWPFNDAGDFVRTLAEITAKTITVRINSPGGDVFDALAMFNALQSHKAKIITRVESLVASAASVLVLAGKEVQAYKNTMMMIHDPWGLIAGNQYDLRDFADILEKISSNMVDIYASNSNVGKREIIQMMKDETWFTAKEAKDKGFIDVILDGKGAKAQFDLSMFTNVPNDLFHGNGNKEPTERDIERALRDAGLSKHRAQAVLARGWNGATSSMEREKEEIKQSCEKIIQILRR